MKKFIIILAVLLLLVSCAPKGVEMDYLPKGAINIKKIDKFWCHFELNGKKFLFFIRIGGSNGKGLSAITQISGEVDVTHLKVKGRKSKPKGE